MLKQEVRQLSSQHRDGTLMYPGRWLFTWLLVGAVWHLLRIEPAT
jgi:hypothetical protein